MLLEGAPVRVRKHQRKNPVRRVGVEDVSQNIDRKDGKVGVDKRLNEG